jgi:hypothetical protein
MFYEELHERIFRIDGEQAFNALALELFRLHATKNQVYRRFLGFLGTDADAIDQIDSIPSLPISFFKNEDVIMDELPVALRFGSSGTSTTLPSTHCVTRPAIYERSYLQGFENIHGRLEDYRILGLLPSYLERKNSSLVHMVNGLIERSGDPLSGTYLDRLEELHLIMEQSEKEGKPTILIGVSFALLDLAEHFPMKLRHTKIVETGGMKGRRKELVRSELHSILSNAFDIPVIHSEYGMTELLSQAWSTGHGLFECPPWMKVRVRDTRDPFSYLKNGRAGGLNVIDLANIHSCPFIATDDIGRAHPNGLFEVLGRFDQSDVRGCNLMIV